MEASLKRPVSVVMEQKGDYCSSFIEYAVLAVETACLSIALVSTLDANLGCPSPLFSSHSSMSIHSTFFGYDNFLWCGALVLELEKHYSLLMQGIHNGIQLMKRVYRL